MRVATRAAVALDVGGVLYYDEPFELAWLQGAFDRMVAADPSVSLTAFLDLVERFYSGLDDGSVRPELPPVAARESWAHVRRAWPELAQPLPGAVRCCADIARRHPTVVVANQPPECLAVLTRWGLAENFAAVFLDSLAGVAKPDTRLLGMALTGLGVAPAEMVVVGNRVDHDVTPARALGCPVVFVRADEGFRRPAGIAPDIARVHARARRARTAPPPPDPQVRTVASLAELSELLARFEAGEN